MSGGKAKCSKQAVDTHKPCSLLPPAHRVLLSDQCSSRWKLPVVGIGMACILTSGKKMPLLTTEAMIHQLILDELIVAKYTLNYISIQTKPCAVLGRLSKTQGVDCSADSTLHQRTSNAKSANSSSSLSVNCYSSRPPKAVKTLTASGCFRWQAI